MKVLMYEFFLPDNTYTYDMCAELSQYADITMACRKGASRNDSRMKWKDILFNGYEPIYKSVIHYPASLMKLAKEIKTGHYDVLHVQFFRKNVVEIPYFIYLKKYCKCMAHTVHNVLPHEAAAKDRERYQRFYDACDLLMVHNEYSKKLLMEEYHVPEKKIAVVPMGGYTYHELDSTPHDEVHLLHFGQIRPYKGIDITLKALAKLPEDIRNRCRLRVCGTQFEEIDKTDYPAMAEELGISNIVTFDRRFIKDDEIPELMNWADVLLCPFKVGYGSASLMMAWSYGKPAICSDLPALKEETMNGMASPVFKSEDPDDMARALEAFVLETNPDKYKPIIKELIENKFNWRISAKKLYDAYARVLEDKYVPA